MKKLVLAGCMLLSTAASYAQFTFTPNTTSATGVSFVAGTPYADVTNPATQGCTGYNFPQPTTTAPGMIYTFQTYGNAVYSLNNCTGTALSVGAGAGPGNDGTFAVPGSIGYGLSIASGYTQATWGTNPCVAVNPSFGFNFATTCPVSGNGFNSLATGQNPISVDLSTIAGSSKKLYINYIGKAPSGSPTLNTKLQLFRDPSGDGGAGAFIGDALRQPSVDFVLDQSAHQLVIDFKDTTVNDANILAAVRQISFIYYGTTITTGYDLKILGISIGTATPLDPPTAASTKNANAFISTSNVYPNPVSDIATLALELKAPAQVKISLSDMMGKEVLTIAEGTMNSVNESFSVAGLQKGIYTVNYTVDGNPAKSSLLMVK
jgi:hypothetical protein